MITEMFNGFDQCPFEIFQFLYDLDRLAQTRIHGFFRCCQISARNHFNNIRISGLLDRFNQVTGRQGRSVTREI